MLRNREFSLQLGCLLLVTAGFSTAAACLYPAAGLVTLVGMLALDGCFLAFTAGRYREIRQLCGYLASVTGGGQSLDIRDNREGELSILKNDLYKLTVKLQEQSELLKKDKKYLADAIADISHQLKTPLTSIIVLTDLLSGGGLSEEKRREFTGNIHTQLERIEWLVTSLLKLSKIDAGAVEFKREAFPVAEAVRRATAPMLIPMELREQLLTLDGGEDVEVLGDLSWTTEALLNIVKNCVEHTGIGGRIGISWLENPLHVEIAVRDSGSGIDAQDLPHIFERFYRGKNASPDSVGIGLAMAKTVLLNQNADVFVQSEADKGTLFTIKFYKAVV